MKAFSLILTLLYLNISSFVHATVQIRFYKYLLNSDSEKKVFLLLEKDNYDKEHNLSRERFITEYSTDNGKLLKKIPVHKQGSPVINISHNGRWLIFISSPYLVTSDSIIRISMYDNRENKWLWEKEINKKALCINASFDNSDSMITVVTTSYIIKISTKTGNILCSDSKMYYLFKYNEKNTGECLTLYNLSNTGKYFVWQEQKYLVWSRGDDGGCLRVMDLFSYGLKWISRFGSIPNYIYVWNIEKDSLYMQIRIPYEALHGSAAFSHDDKYLFLGPFNQNYSILSLNNKNLVKEFKQEEKFYQSEGEYYYSGIEDNKTINPIYNILAVHEPGNDIYLIDYSTGRTVKKFGESKGTFFGRPGAMGFTSDGKYFATIELNNENDYLVLYNILEDRFVWKSPLL